MSPASLTLAVSASGVAYSCVLRRGDERYQDPGIDGLAAAVQRLFSRCNCRPAQLGELLLDLGPGSYTGLRVAVTFARTLQTFADIVVRSATSIELLALREWTNGTVERDVIIRPILDARRGRFHHAAVRLAAHVELQQTPAAVEPAELLAEITPGEVLLVDATSADMVEAVARERNCSVRPLDPAARSNLGTTLLDPRLAPRTATRDQLEPLYLMGSYAGD